MQQQEAGSPSPLEGDRVQNPTTLSRLLRNIWLGAFAVAILVAVTLGIVVGIEAAILALASIVLVSTVWLFWTSLQALTGKTRLTLDEAIGLAAPTAFEEQKRTVLRVLKDLEYERAVGKLSEEDYLALSARYRREAKTLLAALDESLSPMRQRAESLLAERLRHAGLGRDGLVGLILFLLTITAAPANAETPSAANPHATATAGAMASRVSDRLESAADLAPGTIEVLLRDSNDQPLQARAVRLDVNFHSISEGDHTQAVHGTTDAQGRALFAGQPVSTDYSYRVFVPEPPATFHSDEFQLVRTNGHRVIQHAFPVLRDMRTALVGTRAVVFISPQDEIFRFEVSYRVYNVSTAAWVPLDVLVPLPRGAKALTMGNASGDQRVVQINNNLALEGTYAPGQHDLSFTFNLDRDGASKQLLTVGLPPRLADVQFLIDAAKGMSLEVSGFPEAQETTHTTGQRMLFTGDNYLRAQKQSPRSASIVISGLPTPSAARWIAIAIAALFAAAGVSVVTANKDRYGSLARSDAEQARKLLLDELVELERSFQQGTIGPRTHERTRTLLVDALARLEARLDGQKVTKKRRSQGSRRAPLVQTPETPPASQSS